MAKIAVAIAKAVKELVQIRETNLGIEITVPVAYPGGDLVEVVAENSEGGFSVHDSGIGLMRVTRSGLPHTRGLINRCKELASRFDCSFTNSRVIRSAIMDDIGVAIALVANASRAIADQALEPRRHSEYEFRHEVVERVREFAGLRLRENQEFKGASGKTYRIPAMVLDRSLIRPKHFVAALATRSVVPNHFAEAYDLRDAFRDVQNEAVYDDASDFRQEDYALLRSVARPIALSQTRYKLQGLFADEAAKPKQEIHLKH